MEIAFDLAVGHCDCTGHLRRGVRAPIASRQAQLSTATLRGHITLGQTTSEGRRECRGNQCRQRVHDAATPRGKTAATR